MKTKFIISFVLGLGVWLLLTNYQVVYSKLTSFTLPSKTATEEQSESAQISVETSEIENLAEEYTSEADSTAENDSELPEEISPEEVTAEKATSENSQDEDENTAITANESDNSDIDIAQSNQNDNNQKESDPTADTDTTVVVASVDSSASTAPATTTATPNTSAMHGMWMPPMQGNIYNPWMNPMNSMMMPMMAMMGTMMNPAMYMNPMTMMNHPMNTMTQAQNMNAMMMGMDPKMMFSMFGQPSKSYQEGEVPDQLPVVTVPGFPTQTYQNWPKNKVSPGVSREAKKNAFQTAMAVSPLSMRDMLSVMAEKIPVAEDVSWDDAVEAMKLRANEVNFKFVGSSPLWKQIEAETEQPSAKVEMFRFCDARMARKILDEVPEFIVFLPCKIALIEDGDGKLWVMTLDWDVAWLDYAQNPNNHLPKDIREDAKRIRDNIHYIMEGAATGDF